MKNSQWVSFCFFMILPLILIGTAIAAGIDQRPITIGVLENRNYSYADMMRKSFELALRSINRQGGIDGRMLALAYADDGGDKRTGVEAVEQLVRDKKVVMLTGGYSSTNALAMAQRADALNIPLLVSTASDDRITRRHGKNIFRLNPPAREYAFGLEHLLQQKLQPKSMAIVYENSPFGTGAAMRMMWFCRDNDIDITVIIPYHKERAAVDYFDRIIAPLKRNPPQTIFLVSYKQDGVMMVQRIRTAGITAQLLGGAGGFTHPDFIKETRGASDFLMTAALWSAQQPYPLARRYARLYKDAHGDEEPDYHGAEAYSALMVVADALRRAKSMQPDDIRDALQKTRLSTPLGHVAFSSYDGFERQNRVFTLVLQALNGRYACVWPGDSSMAQLVLPNPEYLKYKGMKAADH